MEFASCCGVNLGAVVLRVRVPNWGAVSKRAQADDLGRSAWAILLEGSAAEEFASCCGVNLGAGQKVWDRR